MFRPRMLALAAAALLAPDVHAISGVVVLDTEMDGRQAQTGSTATGSGTLTLDVFNSFIDYDITVNGLSSNETAAYIRGPAAPGFPGPIVAMLPLGMQKTGTATIDPGIAPAGEFGLFYVDIRTKNFPEGEVRGQVTPRPIPYCYCEAPLAPCNNFSFISGCSNSTGLGALLESTGLTSIRIDSLVLNCSRMPSQTPCLFYGSPVTADPPQAFGDGLLCILNPIRRLPPRTADAQGFAQVGTFLKTLNVNPGEAWCFQCWYRDLSGPCNSGYNTSNALFVRFTP